jgi:predicted nucleic acid-binding protein
MIVLDSSALIDALVYPRPNPDLRRRLDEAKSVHVPHLLDLELLHVLRGLVRGGKISPERADDVRRDVLDLPLERYPHVGLSERVWELRHNFTAYDAAYIALSEALRYPLVTADSRIASAGNHHRATVELYELRPSQPTAAMTSSETSKLA